MNIAEMYLSLVRSPHIPKVYRDIRRYYIEMGMREEADAFANLILSKFNEDVRFYEFDDTPSDKE